MTKNYAAPLRV